MWSGSFCNRRCVLDQLGKLEVRDDVIILKKQLNDVRTVGSHYY